MVTSDVLLFVRVAETASFKDAARQTGVSTSQASKRIASLEKSLGVRLLYRSPRSLSLTSAGETLLYHCRRLCEIVEESRAALGRHSKPAGRLRFSVPTCLGAALLPRLHMDFAKRYPEMQLDAHTSDAFVDIVAGGYDVVIRVAQRLLDSKLTARRLATAPLVLAAAPSYLEKRGTPSDVGELVRHQCLGLKDGKALATRWHFTTPNGAVVVPVHLTTVADSNLALVLAARAGLGLVYVPRTAIAHELRHGALREVLPEFCKGLSWGVFAMHAGRTPTSNAAAFIEFVRTWLPQLDLIDRWQPPAPPGRGAVDKAPRSVSA